MEHLTLGNRTLAYRIYGRDVDPGRPPVVLVANKLDAVHRRQELLPWLKDMQERHPFTEYVPLSASNANTHAVSA